MWTQSNRIIILYYRAWSCGKFLSNILSFHRLFVPQICLTKKVKRWHSDVLILDRLESFDEKFLHNRKIQEIFDTIPPTKKECKNWREYELGDMMFWNFDASDLDTNRVHKAAVNILDKKFYAFIMAHSLQELQTLQQTFPNSQVIQITNDERIRQLSLDLKCVSPSFIACAENLDTDNTYIKFDIDNMFNKSLFFSQIDKTLLSLGLEDRSLDPQVCDFYERYIDLYA